MVLESSAQRQAAEDSDSASVFPLQQRHLIVQPSATFVMKGRNRTSVCRLSHSSEMAKAKNYKRVYIPTLLYSLTASRGSQSLLLLQMFFSGGESQVALTNHEDVDLTPFSLFPVAWIKNPSKNCGAREVKCCFQASDFLGLHMKGVPLWPITSVVEHIDLPFLAAKENKKCPKLES